MLQHGEAVHSAYLDLLEQLEAGTHPVKELQLLWPRLQRRLPPPNVLKRYHVYHDCGKHLCLEIDEHGRRHFPCHAERSAEQFAAIFPGEGLTISLIRHDMDFHTLRGDDLTALWKNPLAPALYLTAWAEISANATMFGGTTSDSYKIKAKRLIQAGKKFTKETS